MSNGQDVELLFKPRIYAVRLFGFPKVPFCEIDPVNMPSGNE